MKLMTLSSFLVTLVVSMGSAMASCPSGTIVASPTDARANVQGACAVLHTWDIARLADGGSMDGPGYGCKIRDQDSRQLGNELCKKPESFEAFHRDHFCGAGYTLVDVATADAFRGQACRALGEWYIARLAGGGSMDGSGYGCGVRSVDQRGLGDTLCAKYQFAEGQGD